MTVGRCRACMTWPVQTLDSSSGSCRTTSCELRIARLLRARARGPAPPSAWPTTGGNQAVLMETETGPRAANQVVVAPWMRAALPGQRSPRSNRVGIVEALDHVLVGRLGGIERDHHRPAEGQGCSRLMRWDTDTPGQAGLPRGCCSSRPTRRPCDAAAVARRCAARRRSADSSPRPAAPAPRASPPRRGSPATGRCDRPARPRRTLRAPPPWPRAPVRMPASGPAPVSTVADRQSRGQAPHVFAPPPPFTVSHCGRSKTCSKPWL